MMRALKIIFVILFCLVPLLPVITTRVKVLAVTFADHNSSADFSSGDPSQSKQKQNPPIETSKYIGSASCAECHGAEATHYALTAHSKTKLISEKAELNGCEACHGGARDHVDFYLNIQKLNVTGK